MVSPESELLIRTFQIEGSPELTCDTIGGGPPVIFLHGIGGSRTSWTRQLTALAEDFTAIAWDARGYGASGDVPGERRFTHFADDLRRLLDQLNVERAHLVGLSMGARILLTFFPLHKDRVATLTLCDCFYEFQAMNAETQREFLDLREKPLLEGKTFVDLAPALVKSLVAPECSPEVAAELFESIVALRPESYLKTLRATTAFDASANLAEIDVPVQLIFGEHDRLTPPSIGESMLALISESRLSVVPKAGHLSNMEQPTRFNIILRSFLDAYANLSSYR